jgi:phage tail-like protein
MDANGLRVWSFIRPADFRLPGPPGLQWSATTATMRLSSQQTKPALHENEALARTLAAAPSMAVDAAGTWAFWDATSLSVRVAGAGNASTPLPIPPDVPPGTATPGDIALGNDDVLYMARNGAVALIDRRDRWPPARAALVGFHADRLAPAPDGGMWVLDRAAGRLARLSGLPLRDGAFAPKNDDMFVPIEPNPNPPTLSLVPGALPAGHTAVDVATSPAGQVMILAWRAGADAALLRWHDGVVSAVCTCAGLTFPTSLAWLDEERVTLLVTDGTRLAPQAYVYELAGAGPGALPSGAVHPLVAPWPGGFAKAPGRPPQYPVASLSTKAPATPPAEPLGLRPLRALSGTTYARSGGVLLGALDCQVPRSVWHRLYLEASIPPHCGVRVWAYASDDAAVPAAPETAGAPDWSLHAFGGTAADVPDAARGAWLPIPSELPFNPGLLQCTPQEGRTGLFTVLLQRPGKRVRVIAGRYLWLHIELGGNSLMTPEIAALRVHGPRFSYRDRYLPPLYRETAFPPDADAAGAATPPDFLERFLGLFEGDLTQIEDRIASSWLLTDPAATPDSALPWLASWIGVDLDEIADPARQRQVLAAAPYTAALHGTLGGLMAALELATGGVLIRGGQVDLSGDIPRPGDLALAQLGDQTYRVMVLAVAAPGTGGETIVMAGGSITSGALVVVEGFRLRRTFSTILGADLADENDPLTLGLATSGNSFVGDTLFLGKQWQQDFLALFNAASLSAAERRSVTRFLDELAFRAFVLVHEGVRDAVWRRLTRIVAAASPAHVATAVLPAAPRLIVGVASLVGLDTFLEAPQQAGTVTIDRSRIGLRDVVGGAGRLDERGGMPAATAPTAVIDGPAVVLKGRPFLLSGLRSQPASGRRLDHYVWTWTGTTPAP